MNKQISSIFLDKKWYYTLSKLKSEVVYYDLNNIILKDDIGNISVIFLNKKKYEIVKNLFKLENFETIIKIRKHCNFIFFETDINPIIIYDLNILKRIYIKEFKKLERITDIEIFKNILKLRINYDYYLIYDLRTFKKIKFNELKIYDKISSFSNHKNLSFFKINNEYYLIYDLRTFKRIIWEELKQDEKIYGYLKSNNVVKLFIGNFKTLIWNLETLKCFNPNKYIKENISIYRIYEKFISFKLENDYFLIYNIEPFERINFKDLKNQSKITHVSISENITLIVINESKNFLYNLDTFKKININLPKYVNFGKIIKHNNFLLVHIIKYYLVYDLAYDLDTLKEIKLKILDNHRFYEIELINNFILFPDILYRIYNLNTLEKVIIKELKKGEMITDVEKIDDIIKIQIDDEFYLLYKNNFEKKLKIKGLKKGDKITGFKKKKNNFKIEINYEKILYFDLKKFMKIRSFIYY